MIILRNLSDLLLMFAAYVLLFVLLPFWLRGFRLSEKGALGHLAGSYIIANIVIVNIVYVLALLRVYNVFSLALCVLAVAALYRIKWKRAETLTWAKNLEIHFVNLKDGYYHPRVMLRDTWLAAKRTLSGLFLRRNYLNALVLLAILAFAAYTRCYHALSNMYYGTSDMYAHTLWLRHLNANDIFVNGVYPFGFHNTMSVLTKLGFDVVTVVRLIAPVQSMFIIFALYYALRSLFKSSLAVFAGLAFYCVLHVFTPLAIERQLAALPQEWGMIFMYFCGIYLVKYMRERNTYDLLLFALSVSLTLAGHPYITMLAVVLSLAVFIGHIVYMKRGMFIRLAAASLAAIMLALAPLAAGLVLGIRLEPSFAFGFAQLAPQETTEPEEGEEESPEVVIDLPPVLLLPRSERLSKPIWTLEEYGFFDIGFNNAACIEKPWFFIFLGCAAIGVAIPLLPFKPRRRWDVASFCLYAYMALGLRLLPIFGFPQIMEAHRLVTFFIYSIPFAIGAPFELMYELFHLAGKKLAVAWSALAVFIGGGLSLYTYTSGQYGILPRVVQQQYDGAYYAYYEIIENFDNFTWTIVSSSLEYSFCLNTGYHFNQSEFIMQMEEPDGELIIPTKYIFLYVEKRPSAWAVNLFLGGAEQRNEPFDPADAYADMTEMLHFTRGYSAYLYENMEGFRILQAKTDAWIHEYMRHFLRETEVFYEDDELIVYKITQNPSALNDLTLLYPGSHASEVIP